ncbi:hypothetical protein C1280_06160 [Gemmata obscuriglobus]|uniref:Uncharacterized protein n=1 Tax=Gemmata obscuriglobus TaxID=114 RepID=A0A2Z3GYT2_9BACT|nr:hypothetical protein C1280_06160 [Gemmata obscuriglobus]
MRLRRADGLGPMEHLQTGKPVPAEDGDESGNRGLRGARQLTATGLGLALADEPQYLHPLLHAWIGMRVTLRAESFERGGRER